MRDANTKAYTSVLVAKDWDWSDLGSVEREVTRIDDPLNHRAPKFHYRFMNFGNNEVMLENLKPDLVLIFTKDVTKSLDAADMLRECKNRNIEMRLYDR